MINKMLVHPKDLEKYIVDNEDKRIFLTIEFTEEAYLLIKDLEETFFYPIEDHRNEFNIFIINPLMGNLNCNAMGMKSKEDGTLSTAVFRIVQLLPFLPKVVIDIKRSKENIKRIKYFIEKHNLEKIIRIPKHYKKIFSGKEQKRSPIPESLRHEVFKRDGYRCVECGATNRETTLHVDHIIPKSEGGTDELDNLQTLCEKCNLAKKNRKWKGGDNK